jgi:two-component system response regulator HydG
MHRRSQVNPVNNEAPPAVLVVDSDAAPWREVAAGIGAGLRLSVHEDPGQAIELLIAEPFDFLVVRLDVDLIARLAAVRPGLPFAVVAEPRTENMVAALRAGASDFLDRPIDPRALGELGVRLTGHRGRELPCLPPPPEPQATPPVEGRSGAMRRLRREIRAAARSDLPLLITGETGAGKELVARSVHLLSRRGDRPFVAVNCAALPRALLESELFGHERGAFTDATSTRVGLLAGCRGGTVLLDEIGAMPIDLQPKVLHALEARTVRPLGADREVPFDARLVAATNEGLPALCARGGFRADLFYRLDVLRIVVPPLRDRGEDVLHLAALFVARAADRTGRPIVGLSNEAADCLRRYRWPGNVRELENCVQHAVALCRGSRILPDDLPANIRRAPIAAEPGAVPTLREVEERHIERVLAATGGNRAAAARILGLPRRTLYGRLRQMRARRAT